MSDNQAENLRETIKKYELDVSKILIRLEYVNAQSINSYNDFIAKSLRCAEHLLKDADNFCDFVKKEIDLNKINDYKITIVVNIFEKEIELYKLNINYLCTEKKECCNHEDRACMELDIFIKIINQGSKLLQAIENILNFYHQKIKTNIKG